ncbi:MAG: DedA family protein [Microthrixaceae bacterium]
MTDHTLDTPHLTPPRWFLPAVGVSIVALIVANNVGNVVWSCAVVTEPGKASSLCTWPVIRSFADNPLGLLALNSSNKYLLATSVLTSWLPYAVIAFVRLMLPDPLFYLLGFVYRGRALTWARQVFPGMDPLFDQFEQEGGSTRRLLDAAVLIAPNNPVCLLAGVAAMPWRRFLLLAATGTVGRIALMRGLGLLFDDQIKDLLDLVARYQRWFTIGSVVVVVLFLAYQVVGRRGLVGGVESLDEELGED